jgi:hypothetical protein
MTSSSPERTSFRKVDYFSLAAGYASGVTDMPTYVTSISFDGVSKSVLDYVGREAGMPPGVSDVEVAIAGYWEPIGGSNANKRSAVPRFKNIFATAIRYGLCRPTLR